MKTRVVFIALCLAAIAISGCSTGSPDATKSSCSKQYLELRRYEFASADHREQFDSFLAQAAIPALKKLGIGPVGVFKYAKGDNLDLYVLIPHNCLGSMAAANTKMLQDEAYIEAGKGVLTSPKKNPVYKRFESSLFIGFDSCPTVEVPTKAATRQFQLRIYESHNTTKAKRKVEMFDKGETDLFRETGLNPVFFGEAIAGVLMPNLTYMVGFDNADAQKAAWDKFRVHPKWKEMSSDPYYKDTVSHITNLVLVPTAASEI